MEIRVSRRNEFNSERKLYGITAEMMCEYLNISTRTMSRWLNKIEDDPEIEEKLFNALDEMIEKMEE